MFNKEYVVDFDDFCDATVYTLDLLQQIKEQQPDFKVTLFAIPKRLSDASIKAAKQLPWVYLAPHGWRHTRGECLGWGVEETRQKLRIAKEMGLDAPAFKAPAWLLEDEVYEACRDEKTTICDHRDYNGYAQDAHVYRYNDPAHKRRSIRSIHGHLTNVAGNWIKDMIDNNELSFPAKGTTFSTPWEASVKL